MTSQARALSPEQLLSAISASRDEGEFTDLILRHEAGEFKVHRIILCPQSKFFYKACCGEFEETSTGVIEMKEISYLELEKMVNFFYRMDYDNDIPDETEQDAGPRISLLRLHARMFALGDRYDIPGLRDVAVKKYSSRCGASWEPLEYFESIYDVYGRTPAAVQQLRSAAVALVVRHNVPKMLEDQAVAAAYEKLINDVPDFTKNMLGIFVKAPLYGDCFTCGPNQAMEALQIRCKRCGHWKSSW